LVIVEVGVHDEIELLKEEEKKSGNGTAEGVRTARPVERHHGNHNWVAGVVLVVMGLLFLLGNLTGFRLDNWWALFIFIPAFINLGNALGIYRRHGRFNAAARGMLTGSVILTTVALAFLLDLDWGIIWPLFLIIAGIAALLNGWFR
jgi:hypothetical protein